MFLFVKTKNMFVYIKYDIYYLVSCRVQHRLPCLKGAGLPKARLRDLSMHRKTEKILVGYNKIIICCLVSNVCNSLFYLCKRAIEKKPLRYITIKSKNQLIIFWSGRGIQYNALSAKKEPWHKATVLFNNLIKSRT